MDDAGVEISNYAINVLFGAGGFLVAIVPSMLTRSRSRGIGKDECARTHDKLDENIKGHEVRIQELERHQARAAEVMNYTSEGVRRIEKKIDEFIKIK